MFGPQSVKLLSGVPTGSEGDGSWYYIGNWYPGWSVMSIGLVAGDKTQIWVSDNAADSPPAAFTTAAGAFQLGSDITADGVVTSEIVYSWICIRKTAHAGGGAIVVRASALVV